MEEESRNRPSAQTRNAICTWTTEALARIGFLKSQMSFQEILLLRTDEGEIEIPIEILVSVEGKPALLVKCIDGHTSAREQAAVAMARLHPRGPFPVVLVANGSDVVVIDTATRRMLGFGFEAVPTASSLRPLYERESAVPGNLTKPERDKRILAAYYHLRCPIPKDPY
jgi:hypothetical protein